MKKYICCLCGKEKEGYGNNPWPLAKTGRCCNNCNIYKVIPARLNLSTEEYEKKVKEENDQ